jgi:hypothetical protein
MIASSTIYGQVLLQFPEEFQPFEYFDMDPLINDNYVMSGYPTYSGMNPNIIVIPSGNVVPYGTYMGIFQNDTSEIKDRGGNLVTYAKWFLWAEEVLIPGKFVKYNGVVHRIVPANEWNFYGGFVQYELEKMIGSDGQGTSDSGITNGSPGDFS